MTKIKICGLSRVCDIQCVNEFQPDYVGFICKKPPADHKGACHHPRMSLDESIEVVGVFVDELPDCRSVCGGRHHRYCSFTGMRMKLTLTISGTAQEQRLLRHFP